MSSSNYFDHTCSQQGILSSWHFKVAIFLTPYCLFWQYHLILWSPTLYSVSAHKFFSFVYIFWSVSSWPCWIKMVFMPFFRAFKVSWSWIFYPSVCAFHYTSTIARGEQKLNTCVINNRFDMKKVKGTDRPDVCFLLFTVNIYRTIIGRIMPVNPL